MLRGVQSLLEALVGSEPSGIASVACEQRDDGVACLKTVLLHASMLKVAL